MKEIEIKIEQNSTAPSSDIDGIVTINYVGRFDGVQINTYILGTKSSNVVFTSLNGKAISLPARLFVSSDTIRDKRVFRFKARVQQNTDRDSKIRFRAAMIQEHKEIASDVLFLPLRKA